MTTLATLRGNGHADKGTGRPAPAATTTPRPCSHRVGEASIAIPKLGVTVSISAQGLNAAADLAHNAVRLGHEGVQLVGKAVQAAGDAAGTVVEGGVVAALTGGALLASL